MSVRRAAGALNPAARLLAATAGAVAFAAVIGPMTGSASAASAPGPILNKTEITGAKVDECFKTIGDHTPVNADGTCPTGYQKKINDSYIFGSAKSGDFAYFGTSANAVCTMDANMVATPEPTLTKDANVCEYAKGTETATFGPSFADSRTPHVVRLNSNNDKVEDVTPDDPNMSGVAALRGAAAHNDVVFMFGQKLPTPTAPARGLAVFAFEGSTGKYLGSTLRTDVINARQGAVGTDGNLYIAARKAVAGTIGTGVIWKWTGDKSNPFQFENVGEIPNDAAYITPVGDRLAISGWTSVDWSKNAVAVGESAKVWMSPVLTGNGLTAADKASWTSIFDWKDFDPDPIVGKSVVWGAITEWRGDLYVGSYNHAAVTAVTSLWNAYGRPAKELDRVRDATGANRTGELFRISKPGTPGQKVTLLYGESTLPVYDPATKKWANKPNKLGQTAKFGHAGFGNPANAYIWMSTVFQDKLYISTFDESGLMQITGNVSQRVLGLSDTDRQIMEKVAGPVLFNTSGGSDVWRFDDPSKPAVAETLNGFGNHAQHGVRAWIPFENKGFMYAGMASAWNLRATDKDRGGWKINKLVPGKTRSPLSTWLPNEISKIGMIVAGGE